LCLRGGPVWLCAATPAGRAGLLTEVHSPTPEEEAVRDLCRCREAARQDLLRARHRLGKYLLRRGLVYRAGRNWTERHRAWLSTLRFEHGAEDVVFGDYLLAVELLEERLRGLEQRLEETAQSEPWAERVGWLRCFRGIDTVTALTIVAELHDFRRFHSPRQLMAYLGLVLARGKPRPKAVTAVARELTGFLWAALYLYPQRQVAKELG